MPYRIGVATDAARPLDPRRPATTPTSAIALTATAALLDRGAHQGARSLGAWTRASWSRSGARPLDPLDCSTVAPKRSASFKVPRAGCAPTHAGRGDRSTTMLTRAPRSARGDGSGPAALLARGPHQVDARAMLAQRQAAVAMTTTAVSQSMRPESKTAAHGLSPESNPPTARARSLLPSVRSVRRVSLHSTSFFGVRFIGAR